MRYYPEISCLSKFILYFERCTQRKAVLLHARPYKLNSNTLYPKAAGSSSGDKLDRGHYLSVGRPYGYLFCSSRAIEVLNIARDIACTLVGSLHSNLQQRGLTRESSSLFKPTFYPCTVFRQPRPLPEGAISCRKPAVDCIEYYRTGGVTRDNSVIYDFYALAARWTAYAKKIDSSVIFT